MRLILLLTLFMLPFLAHAEDIDGPTFVNPGQNATYSIDNGINYLMPQWVITNGTKTNEWRNGTIYYVTITWGSSGSTGRVTLNSYNNMVSSKQVYITQPPATPSNPIASTNTCGTKTLTRQGTPPSGVTWYWQTSSLGTSTSLGYGSTYSASVSGTYYLRARNNQGGLWSSGSGAVSVSVTQLPANPPAPSVTYACGSAELLAATPPSGTNYYWQTSAGSTSTASPEAGFTVYSSGTYYLRAEKNGCWSNATSITVYLEGPAPTTFSVPEDFDTFEGQQSTYWVDYESTFSAPSWSIEGGEVIESTLIGTKYSVDILWGASGSGRVIFCNMNRLVHQKSFTITPPSPVLDNNFCGTATLSRIGTPIAGSNWYWQTSSSGTSTALGYGATLSTTVTGSYFLRPKYNGVWGPASRAHYVNINQKPAAPTGALGAKRFFPGEVTLSVTDEGLNYFWYLDGQNVHEGAVYETYLYETTTYEVKAEENGCFGDASVHISGEIFNLPEISSSNGFFLTAGQATTLSIPDNYVSYQWTLNKENISGALASQITVAQAGLYGVKVSLDGENYYEAIPVRISILDNAPTDASAPALGGETPLATSGIETINFVRKYSARTAIPLLIGAQEPDYDNSPIESITTSTQYIDGLGRPVQTVIKQGSPLKKDVIQSVAYDGEGRQHRAYLPYVYNSATGGYRNNHLLEQYDFYRNHDNTSSTSLAYKVARTGVPFSETRFEDSPLNKVVEQSAAGESWSMGSGNTIKKDSRPYSTFQDEAVVIWTVQNDQLVRAGIFGEGELMVSVTEDEHGQQIREYVDKQGQTLLKRLNSNNGNDWLDTYYVYDIFNNLRFVLPPECSEKVIGGFDWATDSGIIDNWAFQYSYDGRKRMISKKVPGAEVVYLVYDNRDRLVLTQDGEQRLMGEWAFTKYDQLNRPILSGVTAISGTLSEIRIAVKNHAAFYEEGGGSIFGYTNDAYPVEADVAKYYTVTYYDDYTFPHASTMTFVPELGHTAPFDRIKGQVTGTITKVLGESKWLKGVTYYDNKYRVIQSQQENLHDDINIITNRYSFVGEVLETQTTEKSLKVVRNMSYDHMGRLQEVAHKVVQNGVEGNSVVLLKNEYNEIGELIEKNLHSEDDKASFAQSVDYTYNTRGWLTKINNSQLSETEAISPADYFGMDLMYNYGFDQVQYNGNIAGVKWKTFGDTNTKAYGYVYDGLNRIRYADYVTGNTGSWTTNAGAYNVNIKDYDRNGNILGLTRYADHAGVQKIDELVYNYGAGTTNHSNQLLFVDDISSSTFKTEGFKDVSGVDYGYDRNGNMKSDANKGITSIAYNHLNLPARVTKDANNYIDYIYDAAGTKLAQIVHENGVEKRTDYIGEFIYEKEGTDPAELQIVQHEEGRVVPDGNGGFIYQYHLKDHLGNVRLSFTTRPETLEFKATFESENATDEETLYSNIAETRVPFNSADANADGGDEVVRLNGSQPVGAGISLPVGAGDEIDMVVFGYYEGGTGYSSSNTTTALVSAVAGAFGGVNGGSGYEQATYDAFEGAYTAPGGMAINGTANDNRPAAYLNYILFDENMVYYQHGHAQISIAADMNHEKISINDIVAPKAGFVYVYVSNESVASNWVYFDDMKVTIKEHPVIQTDDYYPFGLTFNSYQRVTAKENKFKYNGFEEQTDLDWNVYDYQARYYDPAIGRFLNVDPAADLMRRHSPYNYAFDNPIRFTDPDGMAPLDNIYLNEKGQEVAREVNEEPDRTFLIKTTKTTNDLYPEGTAPEQKGNANPITKKEAKETEKQLEAGNFEGSHMDNLVELPDTETRQAYVDVANNDDGKGGDFRKEPQNNVEYGANVKGDGTVVEGQGTPAAAGGFIRGNWDMHSHPSGSYTAPNGATFSATQAPSKTDINSAQGNQYVIGRGSKTVYIYNTSGVVATIPQKYFVNPK